SSRRTATRLLDDDGEPLEDGWRIFVKIPDPPEAWKNPSAKLNFRLRKDEKDFLIKHLVALPSGTGNGETSLLARLVEKRVPMSNLSAPWEQPILDVASEKDREALIRSMRIAALSAIGRGVYASLVESALEQDGVETDRLHRDALKDLVDEYGAEALNLDIPGIRGDFPDLDRKGILKIIEATKVWLAKGGKDSALLQTCYEGAELARKGPVRAKLPNTPFARERRREWSLSKGEISQPLHYRWRNVRRLLVDLQGDA
ncbi:MAG: hypothetical protein ABIJ57_11245, partial [Pseudomonadota bacterium]